MSEKVMYTVNQAHIKTGLSRNTIIDILNTGRVGQLYVGNRHYVNYMELLDYLKANKKGVEGE